MNITRTSFIFIAVFSLYLEVVVAQYQNISAKYTLLSGSRSDVFVNPSYPVSYGSFTPGITPGGRSAHDTYFYNGLIFTFHGVLGPCNDVWAHNLTDKTWAWLAGISTNGQVVAGIQGQAGVSNTPGYRFTFGSGVDQRRKEYFVFGGFAGGASRGDLWSFDLVNFRWTWISGSTGVSEVPIYGRLGEFSSAALPGSRGGPVCTYYEPTGEFLVLGGDHLRKTADMWAFDFGSSSWAWISGNSSSLSLTSVGTLGSWSSANYPSFRRFTKLIVDPFTNIVFFFGGFGDQAQFNDVWAFNRDSLEWAWIAGSSLTNMGGVYGTKGIANSLNFPGGRYGHAIRFHERTRLILLFGGIGHDNSATWGKLSDLWAFNPQTYEWTWISGPSVGNVAANYTAGYKNPIGQRNSAFAIDQESGLVYLFGGEGWTANITQFDSDLMWRLDITTFPRASPLSYNSFDSQILPVASRTFVQISKSTDFHDREPDSIKFGIFRISRTLRTYVIMGGACIVILVAIALSLLGARRYRRKVTRKQSFDTSTIVTENEILSSTSMTNTSSQTTMMTTTLGLYLPGGLQVQAAKSYRVEKELARGGGGSVWLATAFDARLTAYGSKVIVKIPNSSMTKDRDLALFHQEIALLNAFKDQPNIVKLLGFCDNPHSIILRYYPVGSLSKWIQHEGRSLVQKMEILQDISHGLGTLHSNGIAHCDMKPDNILIEEGQRFHAVIADFGVSRIVTDKLLKVEAYRVQFINGASLAFAAPEAIRELSGKLLVVMSPVKIISRDIYALGLIIHTVLKGGEPWP